MAVFKGDSSIEVVSVLANCGSNIAKARSALITYIDRKQRKGRSTAQILEKLDAFERKFAKDKLLHSAFRDARAFMLLPKSSIIPPLLILKEQTEPPIVADRSPSPVPSLQTRFRSPFTYGSPTRSSITSQSADDLLSPIHGSPPRQRKISFQMDASPRSAGVPTSPWHEHAHDIGQHPITRVPKRSPSQRGKRVQRPTSEFRADESVDPVMPSDQPEINTSPTTPTSELGYHGFHPSRSPRLHRNSSSAVPMRAPPPTTALPAVPTSVPYRPERESCPPAPRW